MWSIFSRDPAKDFPYEIGDLVEGLNNSSIWQLHKAKRKGIAGKEDVSIFNFHSKMGAEHQLDSARAAVRRLKTLKHPSILTYIDSLETERSIFLVTERVEPLCNMIPRDFDIADFRKRQLYLSWGIFQITRALSFLNNDGNLRHNNVNLWSVFINEESGEWKLGSVEYISPIDSIYIFLPKEIQLYQPPEAEKGSKPLKKCSVDIWGLGCLIWEIFNGPMSELTNLTFDEQIPKVLVKIYQEMVSHEPDSRPNPADVIVLCRSNHGFFKNDLVDALLFLEEIQVKEKYEKDFFFKQITTQLEHFPERVCKFKILPQLLTAFEYGGAGIAVLTPLLQLGTILSDSEYQEAIVPALVKLFSLNDRESRLKLLQLLDKFIHRIKVTTINQLIFPHVLIGFLDSSSVTREQTVQSIVHLASKLDYNNLNIEVLKHFAKIQVKEEHDRIRTNMIICLSKIAQHLHPQIRQKVLINAFIRGTKDPYPPCRCASIIAIGSTQQYFLLKEIANRVLPSLCLLTVDPDKSVRENVFRAIKFFLSKLEKVSDEPELRESMEADVNTATPNLSNAAATWAGWAVTAVTAKFYRSQSDNSAKFSATLKSKNNKVLSKKPASLEHATNSQSSTSTTATSSSITSMTSLEHDHETQNLQNQNIDTDWDNWNTREWGEMDELSSGTLKNITLSPQSKNHFQEQWINLEEKAEEELAEKQCNRDVSGSGWEDTEFLPLDDL